MSENNQQPPAWKLWWPRPFWKVLLVFLLTNLTGNLMWVGVSMALNLSSSYSIGGGIGGAAGVAIVMSWAGKRRKELAKKPQ
jgi:membrane associated rhomboid family serine protease